MVDITKHLRTWKTISMTSKETGINRNIIHYNLNKIKGLGLLEKKQVNAICPNCNEPIYIKRKYNHLAYRLKSPVKSCIYCNKKDGHERDCLSVILKRAGLE